MNVKNIKAVLRRKFNDFLNSITDLEVRALVAEKSIITGGAIVSLLNNEKVNDYDIYFKDYKTVKAVAEYYARIFNESHQDKACVEIKEVGGPEEQQEDDLFPPEKRIKIWIQSKGVEGEEEEGNNDGMDLSSMEASTIAGLTQADEAVVEEDKTKPRYRPVFFTSNAITLSDGIQIVVRFYGEPKDIHKNYDFVHCTCTWESSESELTLPNEALLAIMNKQLVYVGSKYPIASVIRMRKFLSRGYTINAGQILKMCYQISELDLTKADVLEEQLTGVDVGYFNSLIHAFEHSIEAHKDDKDWTFNYGYVATLVDKIFG